MGKNHNIIGFFSRYYSDQDTSRFNRRLLTAIPTTYDGLDNASRKNALLQDSNNSCIYCGVKIDHTSSTIEHYICQSHNSVHSANPGNLFATCDSNPKGGHGYHCQQYRGRNQNRYFFPFFNVNIQRLAGHLNTDFGDQVLLPQTVVKLMFFQAKRGQSKNLIFTGEIEPSSYLHQDIKQQLEEAIAILNLNCDKLIISRKNQLKGALKIINDSAYQSHQIVQQLSQMSYGDYLLSVYEQISNA